MSVKLWLLGCGLILSAVTAWAATAGSSKVLRVYGPGGPYHVLQECADLFRQRHGTEVAVIKAKPYELDERVREDGDIYYSGAECMLEEFVRRNPGVLDTTSMEKLHPRRIGIIVRKGNPLNISGVKDLQREGIQVLDVKLENMRQFHDSLANLSGNLRQFVYTGNQGTAAWRSNPGIDAWITYRSWHVLIEAESDFIAIPGDAGLRFTPIALTRKTPHRQEATEFIAFLKSEEARQIFEQHGWY